MSDPSGYCIELLQDTFECNFAPQPQIDRPLACPNPKVGQITLRVSDIAQSMHFYQDILGMRLLCWYTVPVGTPFSLYFFGFTEEIRPDSDPTAVVNREWTYSRPYTTLELQVADSHSTAHSVPTIGSIGWQGMVISVSDMDAAIDRLKEFDIPVARDVAGSTAGDVEVKDPDGYSIWLRSA